MYRGGSRWSIAIGALFALSLVAPAAANASTPVTLTLAASVNSPDSDLPMLLTATANPAVAGISVEVEDKSNGTSFPGRTASDGTLQWDIRPLATTYNGAHFFQAISPDDGTFGAAMSNTVEIDFNRHHAAITLVPSAGGSSVITNLDPLILKARVASPDCDGWFDIFQTPGGRVDSGFAAPLLEDGTTECGLDLNLGLEPLGPLTFIADYSQTYANDPGNSGSISFNVTLIPTTTLVTSSRTYLPAGTTTKLTAQVTAPVHSELVNGSGTVTFLDGSTSLGSVPLSDAGDGSASLNVELDTLGPHNLRAAYSGTSDASPSDNSVTVTVLDELAHAVDDGLSASTFYPVVDTYGDTVSINGELAEPEAVSITISNVATGAVVRRFYEPMTGPADYSVVWDGRSVTSTQGTDSKGVRRPPTVTSKLVPAGTYRITTIITDILGAHLTFTDTVSVSMKKLVWYTGTTVLAGAHITARGGSGGSITTSPVYAGGVRLTLPNLIGGEYNAVGYQFTLPNATRYSGLSFGLLGSGSEAVDMGLQDSQLGNWPSGSTWIVDYFSPIKEVSTSYRWTTLTGNITYNRIGRTVRGLVLMTAGGHYDVAKVELTYRYALLQ